MRKSTEFVKNALAFFWRFSGSVWHFFGTFLTSFGIFSDFQSGNPVIRANVWRLIDALTEANYSFQQGIWYSLTSCYSLHKQC